MEAQHQMALVLCEASHLEVGVKLDLNIQDHSAKRPSKMLSLGILIPGSCQI